MKQTCLCSLARPTRALRRAVSFSSAAWKALGTSLLFLITAAQMASGQAYKVTTLHGVPRGAGSADSEGVFDSLYQMARDAGGNIYVAEYGNNTIRKITPGGRVSTLAGLAGVAGSANGSGSNARFNKPTGVAVDASGTVYVADYGNHTIRMISAGGAVTTLAGTAGSSGSADGVGAAARFTLPTGVAIDGSGNLYVADNGNRTLRKINVATATVITLAGSVGNAGGIDGVGTAARFDSPFHCAMDGSGNVVVTDYGNHAIRRVTPAGVVTTIAGAAGTSGKADGEGSAARFNFPVGIAVDGSSNTIFVTDSSGNTVRRITADGVVTTLCGLSGTAGTANGVGTGARLSAPTGVVFDDATKTLLVAEYGNDAIRRVTMEGATSWWAGTPRIPGSADSVGVFAGVYGTAIDKDGTVYVADRVNHVIRKVLPSGAVTTLAGSMGTSGWADGIGTSAKFNEPAGIAVDGTYNVYVVEAANHTVRKITSAGVVTTLAGMAGTTGSADGSGTAARFNMPFGVALNAAGTTLYVTEYLNHTVRKVLIGASQATTTVSTLAGTAGSSGSLDATGTAARFNRPFGIALDPSGANLYIADYNNFSIRRLTLATNAVTTVAGSATAIGTSDGAGAAARFANPRDLAFDKAGNLYITDRSAHTLRKMTPSFVVTTLAGLGGSTGAVNGTGSAARFSSPAGVCVDAGGNLIVGDEGNYAIRKVTPGGVVTTFAGTLGMTGSETPGATFNHPTGVVRDNVGNLFVVDSNNHAIRKINANGEVSTLAGLPGSAGTADGTGSAARFNFPYSLTIDGANNLYVLDTGNHSVRKVTSGGTVTTLAGLSGTSGSANGTGTAARFSSPYGITIDSTGTNLYVADWANSTVRKVVIATGAVSTLAGTAGSGTEVDGTGSAARFHGPNAIAIDAANANLYIGDYGGQTIRKLVLATNAVTTIAGLAETAGEVDGTGSAARFRNPNEMVIDPSGNLLVSDANGHTIRKVTPAGVVTTLAGLGNSSGFADGVGSSARLANPAGLYVDSAGALYIADAANHIIRKAVRASAKAQMISPANGTVLVDPVTTFTWNPGDGATGYALWIGTTPGAYDLYAGIEGTSTSKTVTLPVNTKTYVTLHSLISGAYQSNSYVYEAAPSAKAVLTSHVDGTTLGSAALNLQWSPGIGCSSYAVWVGSAAGGYDLGAIALPAGTTTWSTSVPTDGGPVYVTLWSLINGAYQGNSYWIKTAAIDAQRPAVLTSHANTTKLTSANVNFTWGSAVGATGYALWVGTTPDGYDLYAGIEGANTSKMVSLPTDGRRLYVTVHSLIAGVYKSNAYWFTAHTAAAGSNAAKLNSHVNGATLGGAATTFAWGSIGGATKYYLWVGTKPAAYDLYAGDEGLALSKNLNLPTDGRPIYVSLYTMYNGQLLSNSYWFTCANMGAGNKPALITNPTTNGTNIPGNVTLNWSGGSGVTSYALWVGSSPGAYDLYAADEGLDTSRALSLPTDGRMVYVSLHSLIGGVYQSLTYQYRVVGMTPLGLYSPTVGSTFTSKSATFGWQGGASQYALWIGSAPRAYDIYAGVEGTNTSKSITNLLPSDGRPVYVTIYSMVNGVWQPSDSIYNAWQQP